MGIDFRTKPLSGKAMRTLNTSIVTVACVVASLVWLQGCRTPAPSRSSVSSPPPAPAPVSSPTTEWDLALAFLEALKAKDGPAMAKLLVDEKTFREVVYPSMPYHDPSRPHVADFNWGFIRANTLAGIQKVLASHGGLEAELLDILPLGKVEERKGYKLLPDMDLKLRTKAGRELVLDVLGAMVDAGDGPKLMGFRD
jgi:hypothetical protein